MKEDILPFFIDDLKNTTQICVKDTPTTSSLDCGEVIVCSKSSKIVKDGTCFRFETDSKTQFYTPDINQLLNSFLPYADEFDMTVIILTGIGCDGVDGAKNLKKFGCKVIHKMNLLHLFLVCQNMPMKMVWQMR